MLPEAFDYTDDEACTNLVLELTGLKAKPEDLGGLLEVSAGTKADEPKPVLRPYFVAAVLKDGELNQKRVRSLKGIVFDNPGETVSGLLRRQRVLDKALSLVVPDGMSATFSGGAPTFRTNRRRGW